MAVIEGVAVLRKRIQMRTICGSIFVKVFPSDPDLNLFSRNASPLQ